MRREDKLAYAKRYSSWLVDTYPEIVGIILGGSVARGNDLPISDVDLWCFVERDPANLPIEKHWTGELYIDIEQYPATQLRSLDLQDAYVCGYWTDAILLYDREGEVARCQQRARAIWEDADYRAGQLAAMWRIIERNGRELAAAIENGDAREICRASIFAAWTLSDYLLMKHHVAPGGGRGLARLRTVNPLALDALVAFEGSASLDEERIARLLEVYLGVAERSSFFDAWADKVRWLFANDYQADAFHALWITLGLRIKDARNYPDEPLWGELAAASQQWLDLIGWTASVLASKLGQLWRLIDGYCDPDVRDT